jgi:hypothetical protein
LYIYLVSIKLGVWWPKLRGDWRLEIGGDIHAAYIVNSIGSGKLLKCAFDVQRAVGVH